MQNTTNEVACIPNQKAEERMIPSDGEVEKESSFVSKLDTAEELEDEFRIASDLSFLKDSTASSSPLENFKSSYAKSLADSYRRASLPVVVSAPKGQFYFNNKEVISLNSGYFGQNKYLSLNSPVSVASSLQSSEPTSLPTALNTVVQGIGQTQQTTGSTENLRNLAVQEIPIFVPLDKICNNENKQKSLNSSTNYSGDLVTTTDGRQLVMFSGFNKLCDESMLLSRNGETLGIVQEKDIQNEGLRLEHTQLEGRVQQLCEVLADRDSTIQRLEEDLLRMRMECQRLMVDNRSMKSNLGSSSFQANTSNSPNEMQKLKQQVELLTAQLDKAERSRRTYETATRQLVDFLHTVNSTLSNSCTNLSSPAHSTSSRNSSMNLQSDTSLYETSRKSEAIHRTESVYALPTHTGNRPRVNRSVSTYCVASTPPAKESGATAGRAVNSEFLVTRAKELIASLKSLTRNESVLRLHVEPKKYGSSVASSSGVSLRSFKKESFNGDDHSSTSSYQLQTSKEENPANNDAEAVIQAQASAKLNDGSQPLR
ncbi:uncharacterized protein LOC135206161 isoform X2 [Macrobrachium nipponense]|uniref:uncharacterized protein LOC135206161 isoform X2 n=1 Tax=Macrobrachium nipponense TaxID=159736 RepID=UPI0030C83970